MGQLKINLDLLLLENNIKVPSPKYESPLREKIKLMAIGGSVFFSICNQAKSFNATIRAMGFKTKLRKMDGGWRVWKLN